MRISQILVQVVALNDYDAPVQQESMVVVGDAEGNPIEKLRAWCDAMLEEEDG